jgi:hypothetical protein
LQMLSTHNLYAIHNKGLVETLLQNRVHRQAGGPVRARAHPNLGSRLQGPGNPIEREFRCWAEPKSRETDASGAVLDGERRVENGSRDDIECMGTGLDVSCVVNGATSTSEDDNQGRSTNHFCVERVLTRIPAGVASPSCFATSHSLRPHTVFTFML